MGPDQRPTGGGTPPGGGELVMTTMNSEPAECPWRFLLAVDRGMYGAMGRFRAKALSFRCDSGHTVEMTVGAYAAPLERVGACLPRPLVL
jgi:hypothetical protein